MTSVGAGVDSFFEYAFKWFVLTGKCNLLFIYSRLTGILGEMEFLDVWHEAYAAIMRYSRGAEGFWVSRAL